MATRKINGLDRHVSGWKKDIPDHRDQKFSAPLLKTLFPPAKVDLRPMCSRIENQGHVGSCTANSSTSAIEFLYKKAKKTQPELSRLFLYYATRVWIEKVPAAADDGAQIRDVMKALAKYGTCLETIWPYAQNKFSVEPSDAAKKDALNHQILLYYRCPNMRYIKACMAEGFPCVGGFAVPESMDGDATSKTGIVTYPTEHENFIGGHAVLFVGYNDKTEMLTFQNSWGDDWGDKGFGYLPYKFVANGLASDFWTIRNAEL